MALRLVCMCGYVIEGDDDEEFWSNARDHMRSSARSRS